MRCLHMARWLDRRQVSPFFTCYWLCGGLVSGVCTYWLICERFVQRCVGEVFAVEADVKKGERWYLVVCAEVVPGGLCRGGVVKCLQIKVM
ncbi:MAG: hypothetical protein PHT78_08085 [Desulfitobacteriaceae bacterium]|nr:hypothetical protein [Desulfitobacteriaceae bacterium]